MEPDRVASDGERRKICARRRDHTRQSCYALPQLLEKLDRPLRRVAVKPWIDRHTQQVLRAKAEIDVGRGFETAQEEPGHRKQNHRHGDLRDRQQITQSPTAPGTSQRILPFERAAQQRTRSSPCRGHSQQQSTEDAQSKGEDQHTPIHRQCACRQELVWAVELRRVSA